jgi:hypothetical protein
MQVFKDEPLSMWAYHTFIGQFEDRLMPVHSACDVDFNAMLQVLQQVTGAEQLLEPGILSQLRKSVRPKQPKEGDQQQHSDADNDDQRRQRRQQRA